MALWNSGMEIGRTLHTKYKERVEEEEGKQSEEEEGKESEEEEG